MSKVQNPRTQNKAYASNSSNSCSQSYPVVNPNHFNYEAEVEVLGAIFRDNKAFFEVIDFLHSSDFYDGRHKIIYKAMAELYRCSAPIDIATIYSKLSTEEKSIIGVSYLAEVQGSSCTSINIKVHGEIIKEAANLMSLHLLFGNSLARLSGSIPSKGSINSSGIIDELSDALLNLRVKGAKEDGKLGPYLGSYMDNLQQRYLQGGGLQGIKTGNRSLDKVTGGFNQGDYIILAARPSMGKSALAVNLALNAFLKENARVAYFNLEMSIEQTLGRGLASMCSIPMDYLKNGNLNDDQWQSIAEGANILYNDRLRIFEKQSSLNDIRTQCKILKMREGLDIVFIDYLQLIRSEERYENRNVDVSNISRALKLMAGELNITIIALSQLSRASEIRPDHRPMLSDLRDSGSIEQDADIVMLLYRDGYYNAETKEPDIIECIVAKNRNGEVGTVKLGWKPRIQRVV